MKQAPLDRPGEDLVRQGLDDLARGEETIPALPGWESRSPFVVREGRVDWFHYDPYGRALAKIERGHDRDRADVRELLRRGLVEPARLRELFEKIRPELIRYPALDPSAFARKLDEALGG